MQIQNPILRGFYPDPSVCEANGKYYMVTSTFQYFPGVPVFESDDLINWKQIGFCLTRKEQIMLDKINCSGGVFAPCIRFYHGRFYMTTTNDTTRQNFIVWTDDIYGEWSDPIYIDQDGIDPSLYYEDGHYYFMSNGSDDEGIGGIIQCEIDIETGKKLSPGKCIWQGSGGRYLEGPHLYKINDTYYLLAAEGGTEYGHMVTYAKGNTPFGPFVGYPKNPVLTNRNLGGFEIQGVGHGDLIQAPDGSYWMLHLGFRQTGQYSTFHHLGREVFITPVSFQEDGWFTAGTKGTTTEMVEIPFLKSPQELRNHFTFKNTSWDLDWQYMRHPHLEHYQLGDDAITLNGTTESLFDNASPTFIGMHQAEFDMKITCDISIDHGEAGLTFFMDNTHHYEIAIQKEKEDYQIFLRLCVGNIRSIQKIHPLGSKNYVSIEVNSNSQEYIFSINDHSDGEKHTIELGRGMTKYLSSEVAGGFTGVMIGMYAYSSSEMNNAQFSDYKCSYLKD